uniref:Transmembrane protein 26-like n=1 Tax=Pundamilia nyererei TaxID=303518 RepID=A0A3B4EWM0_9CICH
MFLNPFCTESAILTRALFILVAVIGVLRVASVKNDNNYLFLAFLLLPLVVEMIVTLKMRKGQDYKWFSPPIFLFLITIIPSIWILEIQHQQDKASDLECNKLDSIETLQRLLNRSTEQGNTTNQNLLKRLSTVCANDWILALHQIVLILLIVGKWLLPLGGGVTKDELSQLLLTFVGTAADILEFTSETLSDVKEKNPAMVYVILAVWTWSMLQFPLHLAVVRETFFIKHSTDIWSIIETLFIQDGPFLLVRLTVIIHFRVLHQMLGFFAIKNGLVITLSLYRLAIILLDYRHSMGNNAEAVPMHESDDRRCSHSSTEAIAIHELDELCDRPSSHNSAEAVSTHELDDRRSSHNSEEAVLTDELALVDKEES